MATKPAIKCTPVDLTDEQRANLAKLAAYLRTLPSDYPDFEMNDFVNDEDDVGEARVVCGTAACAVGHAPQAGVIPLKGENWWSYSFRALINSGSAWYWCFEADWSKRDNTVHGAAARIEFLLAHGLPGNFHAQLYGGAPLCYSTEASA